MPSAYQSRPYDDSRTTARMSDLFGQQGQVSARAAEDRAAIDSRKWQGVSNIATDTMRDFVQIAGDYQQRKTAEAARATQTAREAKVDERIAKQDARLAKSDAAADAETAKRETIQKAVYEATDPSTGKVDYQGAAARVASIDYEKAEEFTSKANSETREKMAADRQKAIQAAKGLGLVMIAGENDPAAGAKAYEAFRTKAIQDGLIGERELPDTYDRAALTVELVEAMSVEQIMAKVFAPKAKPALTRVRPGDQFVDAEGQLAFKGPPMPPPGGGGGNPNTQSNTLRDDMRMAEQWKQGALAKLEEKFNEKFMPGSPGVTMPPAIAESNARFLEEHEKAKASVQASYLAQIGAPAEPGTPRDQRNATMRDIVQPPPPNAPPAPLGAGPANATPTAPPPEVAEALHGARPGRHKLSDGSIWQVTGDGRIIQVK